MAHTDNGKERADYKRRVKPVPFGHGPTLRAWAAYNHLSQKDIAIELGTTPQAVSKIFRSRSLGIAAIERYAKVVRADPEDIRQHITPQAKTEAIRTSPPPREEGWSVLIRAAEGIGDNGLVAELLKLVRILTPPERRTAKEALADIIAQRI